MKQILLFSLFIYALSGFSQTHIDLTGNGSMSPGDNISVELLAGDSLSTGFLITIKREVKPHKHLYHSEQIYVLDGEGKFTVDGEIYDLKTGSYFFIPKGLVHSLEVTSSEPVRVLSVQSPAFDGSDRVIAEGE